MDASDLKPFVCHIQFDNDSEDIEWDYSGTEEPYKEWREVDAIRCRVLDGPFAGRIATIEIKKS